VETAGSCPARMTIGIPELTRDDRTAPERMGPDPAAAPADPGTGPRDAIEGGASTHRPNPRQG
jgi:hypothetical protein